MPARPVVDARRLGLRGPAGWAYRDIDLMVPPGALVAIVGPEDGARTQLLLTLAGRLVATAGTVRVCGDLLTAEAGQARTRLALARLPDIVVVDPDVSVQECVESKLVLSGLPIDLFDAAGDLVGFAADPDTRVAELPPVQSKLLAVALAVAEPVELIIMDRADTRLGQPERAQLWRALSAVTRTGVTVVAGTSRTPPHADQVVTLAASPTQQSPQ